MKNYESVLMDWDGNLAKTLDIWLEACREVLLEHGHTLTDLEIGESFGAFPILLANLGVNGSEEGMVRAASFALPRLLSVELYPDAVDLLEHLEATHKQTALITSSDGGQVVGLLERRNLGHFFQSVITGEMTEQRKPHPEPLLLAMSNIGADVDSTIMVGDSDKDIAAATNAGIDSVLFFPPEHQRFYDLGKLSLLQPTFIVESLIDVKEIIV